MLPEPGCWSGPQLITVCTPAASIWKHSTLTQATFSACVQILVESKRVVCCGKRVTQWINLPGCSSPPNEVCEESLLIKYRRWGRCLSFFIRKKGFLHSHSCQWMNEVVLVVNRSHFTVQSIPKSRRLKERATSLCRVWIWILHMWDFLLCLLGRYLW